MGVLKGVTSFLQDFIKEMQYFLLKTNAGPDRIKVLERLNQLESIIGANAKN